MSNNLPTPNTITEQYLASIAGVDVGDLPEPVRRVEQYLAVIAARLAPLTESEAVGSVVTVTESEYSTLTPEPSVLYVVVADDEEVTTDA